ncbi:IFT46 protein, partial [Polypterus senegalus]
MPTRMPVQAQGFFSFFSRSSLSRASARSPSGSMTETDGCCQQQQQLTKLVENQPYDESLEVNDSEEVASETEEEEEEEDEDNDEESDECGVSPEGAYDPAEFSQLQASAEIKELFQYIGRFAPQAVDLELKLRPFIPDFIPAVGDIDPFLKVPCPDAKTDKLGLLVLDEPCTKQSEPTVLSLWLMENSMQHNVMRVKVKSLENVEKSGKAIDSWVENMSKLHRAKPPATVHYSRPMPDVGTLMQEWPPEVERLLGRVGLPTAELKCGLAEYVDVVCAALDVPVYKSRVQSLHVLFTLYAEFKNSQHFKALAEGKKTATAVGRSGSTDAERLPFN